MSDDNVLSWLDKIEGMKPVRRRMRESYSREQIEQLLDDVKSDYGTITPMTISKNYNDLFSPDRREFIERTGSLRLTMLTGPLEANFSGLNREATTPHIKPRGLWYACGIDWILFTRQEYMEGFRGRDYLYHLNLNYTSFAELDAGVDTSRKVLEITSREDVDRIERDYGENRMVNWAKFSRDFGGIQACPVHFVGGTSWGRWWDVNSGCVWESDAIGSAVQISP